MYSALCFVFFLALSFFFLLPRKTRLLVGVRASGCESCFVSLSSFRAALENPTASTHAARIGWLVDCLVDGRRPCRRKTMHMARCRARTALGRTSKRHLVGKRFGKCVRSTAHSLGQNSSTLFSGRTAKRELVVRNYLPEQPNCVFSFVHARAYVCAPNACAY